MRGSGLGALPGRIQGQYFGINRTARYVRAAEITEAHQELAHDLAAREAEGLLEELHPLRLRERMMPIEPGGEGAVLVPELLEPARILDRRIDLEPVADDAGVAQQPLHIARAEFRHRIDVELAVGAPERRALVEDREPREARLVDFQNQALEQHAVVPRGKAVLGVVVG